MLTLLKELSTIYNAYNKNTIIIATKKASDSHHKEELKKEIREQTLILFFLGTRTKV